MQNKFLPIPLSTVVLDSRDSHALAAFYLNMLGWQKTYEDSEWIDIQSPAGGVKIGFQQDPDYAAPGWPAPPPAQQQMLHLDFALPNAEAMRQAVEHAVACGATLAPQQYSDRWTVLLDPAGHPFCFILE